MKKFILLAAVAALAFVGCNKENQEPAAPQPDLVYTGATQVEIKEGVNFYTVKFTANAKWDARIEAEKGMAINKTSGTAGEQEIKVTFEDLGEGETGRVGILGVTSAGWDKQPAEGQYFLVVFIQGKVFLISSAEENPTVGTEGGKIAYRIITNCDWTKIDIKKYDQFEAWAPATLNADKTVLTFDVKANTGYDARQAYVKFTVNEIMIEDAALVARAYANQKGLAKLAWAKSISASTTKFPAGSIARLCYNTKANQIALCNATTQSLFGMSDGSFGGDVTVTADPAVTSYATDAAGNIVMATTAAYPDGHLLIAAIGEGIEGGAKQLVDYVHNSIYSYRLTNVRVCGDVTKDAVICAMTDLYVYCVYWEIKNGVVGEAQTFALPSGANWETWSGIIWNAERNGCVVPLGETADQGFAFIAYDTQYKLFVVDKTGASQVVFDFAEYFGEAASNINFQSISVANFNGDLYALVGLSTYFHYGDCPDMALIKLTDIKMVSHIKHTNYNIPLNYIGADDGENAAADVLLVNEGEKLGAYMADVLNDVVYKVEFPKL